MRISDWSSDVCSSDLGAVGGPVGGNVVFIEPAAVDMAEQVILGTHLGVDETQIDAGTNITVQSHSHILPEPVTPAPVASRPCLMSKPGGRSEERRVRKEWVSTYRSRWSPYHSK